MKRNNLCTFCSIFFIFLFSSCNKKDVYNPYSSERNQLKKTIETTESSHFEESKTTLSENQQIEELTIDYDLTNMSSTMIYAEVFNMLIEPEKYENKRIKMKGFFTIYNEGSNDEVFSVIVPDAAACCQQGIEFFYDFKDKKPMNNSEITVTGIFKIHILNNGISYNYIKAEKIQ